jgi:hypothetical protein
VGVLGFVGTLAAFTMVLFDLEPAAALRAGRIPLCTSYNSLFAMMLPPLEFWSAIHFSMIALNCPSQPRALNAAPVRVTVKRVDSS